jgi:hypothetical protein
MPLTPAKSDQYTNLSAVPPVLNDGRDHGRLRMAHGKLTYTAAGQGDAQVIRLPQGKIRIFPRLGRQATDANAAAASTLSVGLGAYVKADGTTASADVDALLVATAVGAATTTTALLGTAAGQVEFVEVESKGGVDVTITWAAGNSPASGNHFVSVPYCMAG